MYKLIIFHKEDRRDVRLTTTDESLAVLNRLKSVLESWNMCMEIRNFDIRIEEA